MHESRRTEREFARVTEIEIAAQVVGELLGKRKRKFVEQIVRMLSIAERLVVPRFAALKQKRITGAAFSERIETHNRAETDLGSFAYRMGIHRHDPVGRVDPNVGRAAGSDGV